MLLLLKSQGLEELLQRLDVIELLSEQVVYPPGPRLQFNTSLDKLRHFRHRPFSDTGFNQERQEGLVPAGHQGPEKDGPAEAADGHQGVGQDVPLTYRPKHNGLPSSADSGCPAG
jgi:hypothetical protein